MTTQAPPADTVEVPAEVTPPTPDETTPPEGVTQEESTEQEIPATAPPDGETPPSGDEANVSDSETVTPGEETQTASLTTEDFDSLIDLFGPDVLQSSKLQEHIEQVVRGRVERQVRETQQNADANKAVDALIEQGSNALNSLAASAERAQAELKKASEGEEFDAEIFNPADMLQNLELYGSAIVAEVEMRYDKTLQGIVWEQLSSKLPRLADETLAEFTAIYETAKRIRNDPKQGPAVAAPFEQQSVVNWLIKVNREAAVAEERERASKRPALAKKVSEAVAVKAAQAKLVSERGNPPPGNIPASSSEGTTGAYDSDHYMTLLRDPSKRDEARAYADRFLKPTSSSA